MIHYTLLPENEMKMLRREYRFRLIIILLFFSSIAIILGILSLVPSYVLSQVKETQALQNAQALQKGRQERGADQVEKELTDSQALVDKLSADSDPVFFSTILKNINSYRTPSIKLISFDLSKSEGTSTTVIAVIGGTSLTRDSLIEFKKSLEEDKHFVKVELPISDLAKSKNITFALRLTIAN